MSYSDFITDNPIYKKLGNDPEVAKVYNFLSMGDNIHEMIRACQKGESALSGVVKNLENAFPDLAQLPYKRDYLKQSIGVMIKYILAPLGYVPKKPVRMPRNLSDFFSSAHTYEFREELAKFRLIATFEIQPIQPITEELLF